MMQKFMLGFFIADSLLRMVADGKITFTEALDFITDLFTKLGINLAGIRFEEDPNDLVIRVPKKLVSGLYIKV